MDAFPERLSMPVFSLDELGTVDEVAALLR
jgi:hypothetical protein